MSKVLRRTRQGTIATRKESDDNPGISLANISRNRSTGSRSGFDGAASNRFTKNHFADASSSDITSILMGDRDALVKRCRYEYRNNAYAKAMVLTWAHEIVGTGPTLQMQTDNDKLNQRIEELFAEWAQHCDASEKQNLAGMLRTGLSALPQFGEEFTTFTNARAKSRSAARHDVTLRLLEINPQRVSSPLYDRDGNSFDGIELDETTGAPVNYLVYKNHPGDLYRPIVSNPDKVAADDMIHVYLTDEPGQYRGVPMMAPVVTLMGDLRRYTKAVVAAAEQAANISGVIYSTLTSVAGAAKAMEEIEIARNTLLTLPRGYQAEAFKPAQPVNTYGDFKTEIIGEIGRAFMMPFLVASGNAAGYNYSSGRLDLQDWWKAVGIVQDLVAARKLDVILARFLHEAVMINRIKPGYLPGFTKALSDAGVWNMRHSWNWPGHEHVDPKKEADAQKVRLENRTTTLAAEYAKQGKDWQRELAQIARERAEMEQLGLITAAPDDDDNADDKNRSASATPELENRSASAEQDAELYLIDGVLHEVRDGKMIPVVKRDADEDTDADNS